MGGSKRGWLTWMVGAADSYLHPRVAGIIPLIPIVPSMVKDLHR
jgi:PhoPQ-activated pathogenicity-related protein